MSVPDHVGVIGGGRMGAGIALAFSFIHSKVLIVERNEEALQAARQRLEAVARKAIEHGSTEQSLTEILSRIDLSTDYREFAHSDLVIEAVPEDFDTKVAALTNAESHMKNAAWLASNTSSLSITKLSAYLQRPERFCGLHFFNPVTASALIEVVLTATTSESLREVAQAWVESLGKTPIVARDTPGFASSRLGTVLALEAMRMLEEGVASAEDIDAAMVLGYRHATGPLKTSDLIGLDVKLGIAEYLESTLGERFEPPQILRDKVARGELGRKTGTGFFDYR